MRSIAAARQEDRTEGALRGLDLLVAHRFPGGPSAKPQALSLPVPGMDHP